jgi:dihydropteroate synthase
MNVFAQPFTLMGIVNVTPDSFYDGGRFYSTEKAIEQGVRLAEQGASILDIGGASSRPGALEIQPEKEMERIIPVIQGLAKKINTAISVDTTSSRVASAALDEGAAWINDISAGRNDPAMKECVARKDGTIVLMHSRGTPQTMQQLVTYSDVVSDVKNDLLASAAVFCNAGVKREKIVIDPGIGFAKTAPQNVVLLHGLRELVSTGFPVLVGTSRKSFIGYITGKPVAERLEGSLGSVAAAYVRGVRLFRVHDVAATMDFLKVLSAIHTLESDNIP